MDTTCISVDIYPQKDTLLLLRQISKLRPMIWTVVMVSYSDCLVHIPTSCCHMIVLPDSSRCLPVAPRDRETERQRESERERGCVNGSVIREQRDFITIQQPLYCVMILIWISYSSSVKASYMSNIWHFLHICGSVSKSLWMNYSLMPIR